MKVCATYLWEPLDREDLSFSVVAFKMVGNEVHSSGIQSRSLNVTGV